MKTLAEQVGEEVMGYTMKWVDASDWNQEMPAGLRDDWGYATLIAEDDGLKFEWAPEENVNDWWELVEKMKDLGWLMQSNDYVQSPGVSAWFTNLDCTYKMVAGFGKSLFGATCKAALAAVRGE